MPKNPSPTDKTWGEGGDEVTAPNYWGDRRGPGTLLVVCLSLGVVLAALLILAAGWFLRNSQANNSAITEAAGRSSDEKSSDSSDIKELTKALKELVAVNKSKAASSGDAEDGASEKPGPTKKARQDSTKLPPQNDPGQAGDAPSPAPSAAPVNLQPLQDKIGELATSVNKVTEKANETFNTIHSKLGDQEKQLARLESILDAQRKSGLVEKADVIVLAFNSKDQPFAQFRSAYESLLFDQTQRAQYADFRLALGVATGAKVDWLVPLAANLPDVKVRADLKKIVPAQAPDDPRKAVEEVEKHFDINKTPTTARRCVLVVAAETSPLPLNFAPGNDWRGLKVDVLMLASDKAAAPDALAWLEFCTSRNGTFRMIKFAPPPPAPNNAQQGGAGAPPADHPALDSLRSELIRLTQPIPALKKG